jgi:two-component system sensor histidine kinase RegB
MRFFETSKYFSLKKSTYINLRFIAIIGQLVTVNLIYYVFDFKFDLTSGNLIILIGLLSNLYLLYINKNTQLLDKIAFLFLLIDIFQLSCLIYLT